jgi:NAD(P)-dependent dehydrogenase (short-subunit alcohol dehydrogenase family)
VGANGLPVGVAVVTGASGGMGSQCARLMAEAGWPELLICDLEEARLEAVAAPLRAAGARVETLAGDISAKGYLDVLAGKLGAREIGALIHAAGVAPQISTPDRVFDVNLDAALGLWRFCRPRMASGSAAVLFASIAGHLPVSQEAEAAFEQPIPADGSASLRHYATDSNQAYLLAKRALIATVKREAKPLFAERGARLLSVSPGMIDTGMTQGVVNDLTISLFATAAIPRYGRPEEVAAACVFFCSPAASFITGCDLLIDGGEAAGLGL